MAVVKIIQGTTQSFSIDMSSVGTPTAVWFKLYDNRTTDKVTLYKWKYPVTTGWNTVTLAGTTYSFELTDDQSALLLGNYNIELSYTIGGKDYVAQSTGSITITEKAS
jgi:hypothetical protein